MSRLTRHLRVKSLQPIHVRDEIRDVLLVAKLQNLLPEQLPGLSEFFAAHGVGAKITDSSVLLTVWAKDFMDSIDRSQLGELLQAPVGELFSFLENALRPFRFVWRVKDREIRLGARTHIMGVINVTPDSFSDGGKYFSAERAVEHGLRLIEAGADILDVGGESTRPGAKPVSLEEELQRVVPVIRKLREKTDVPISIDTYKSTVAREAIAAGATIINDISGLRFDPEMALVARKTGAGLVLMHIKGTPQDMQKNPVYKDVMEEILTYLAESVDNALAAGIGEDRIVIDPGIGFGKRWFDNYDILNRLQELSVLNLPVLVGASRKSFIGKISGADPESRLPGSIAAHALAILRGAQIVRVHDVAETRQADQIIDVALRRDWGILPEQLEEAFHA